MISFKFRSSLVIALICFALGFCLAFLLTAGCNEESNSENTAVPKILKLQADSINASYQTKITLLENKNQQLQKELTTVKTQLDAAKIKTKAKAETIKKMVEPKGFPAKDLLKKPEQASVEIDERLLPCDSLAEAVSEYIQETELKDSLYETQASLQDGVISIKDSVITEKSKQYESLSLIFNQSISEQMKLLSENKNLRKQIKRQKIKGRLFSLGTAIISGLATHYLTR